MSAACGAFNCFKQSNFPKRRKHLQWEFAKVAGGDPSLRPCNRHRDPESLLRSKRWALRAGISVRSLISPKLGNGYELRLRGIGLVQLKIGPDEMATPGEHGVMRSFQHVETTQRRNLGKAQQLRCKLRNRQTNWERHAAQAIASDGGVVALEDLKLKEMSRSRKGTKRYPGKSVTLKRALKPRVALQAARQFSLTRMARAGPARPAGIATSGTVRAKRSSTVAPAATGHTPTRTQRS